LLISTFAVPRELVETFAGARRWLLDGLIGLALCKLVYFFQDISTAVSIQSLVVMAIDRYRGVVNFPISSPIHNTQGLQGDNSHHLDRGDVFTRNLFLYCTTGDSRQPVVLQF